ncbi:MAG: dTDP-4-dehydrorhamnose 3,5-epimerase family protein [Bacteriovoracaceae bacterium]|nr:dTDP-4-dehydrorhamnose 3,5-epimerase family protein [Bacteriovoracaceae bacterium]
MGPEMINGVKIKPLRKIPDERGMVMHMLRSDSDTFAGFGEAYFSVVNSGVIKGWKYHKEVVQNMVAPVGMIKMVLFDSREKSDTRGSIQEVEFGLEDYKLITIPARIWYSFKGISESPSIIANITSKPYSPVESITKQLGDYSIPYFWDN